MIAGQPTNKVSFGSISKQHAIPWIRRDTENRRNLAPSPTSCSRPRSLSGHLERWTSSSAIRWAVALAPGVCLKRNFAQCSLLGSAPRSSWASTGRRCSCWQVYLRNFFDQPSTNECAGGHFSLVRAHHRSLRSSAREGGGQSRVRCCWQTSPRCSDRVAMAIGRAGAWESRVRSP